jgi:hypothetical protein
VRWLAHVALQGNLQSAHHTPIEAAALQLLV